MHDDAGQILTGLALMARVLADRLENAPAERQIADRTHDGIGEVLDCIRDISKGLIPVEVDASGLMAALAALARRTEGLEGVACCFVCDEPVTVRDNTIATQLYRIAQEAVTNAIRHGSPTHIRIVLGRADGWIHLEVRDDGRGFPASLDESAGRGLRIMRYCAAWSARRSPSPRTSLKGPWSAARSTRTMAMSSETSDQGGKARVFLVDDHPIVPARASRC